MNENIDLEKLNRFLYIVASEFGYGTLSGNIEGDNKELMRQIYHYGIDAFRKENDE